MPCEGCNVQFTVFKRKRLCSECRRFYCNNCLIKRNDKILCERCVVLTARPLSKVDLLKLKPKDLIFYLQSKHISTTGCVEKEELVNLVLTHVNSTSNDQTRQSSNASSPQRVAPDDAPTIDSENCSNPFDQIKQTCQSLFNSFAEKIVDLNFENKPTSNTPSSQHGNIFNQPRCQTREMPTYASSTHVPISQSHVRNPMHRSSSSTSDLGNANRAAANSQSVSSSDPSSPVISLGSASSRSAQHPKNLLDNVEPITQENFPENIPSVHKDHLKKLVDNLQDVNASGCDCSDDEILTEFSNRYNPRPKNHSSGIYVEKLSPASQTDSAFEDQMPGPSGSGAQSASPSKISSGENQRSSEESSGSSFEELGAVGGAGDWQFVEKKEISQTPSVTQTSNIQDDHLANNESLNLSTASTFQIHSSHPLSRPSSNKATHNKIRRINRRRSDTCILNSNSNRATHEVIDITMEDDESDDGTGENPSCKRLKHSCQKCGRTKNNFRNVLLKFRRHLEARHMSEAQIQEELELFLMFLECYSSRSLNSCNSDASSSRIVDPNVSTVATVNSITVEDMSSPRNSDDGIHVYGSRAEETYGGPWRHDSRFINLADFKSSSELEELSVKQLKEILMLNRVDFKGCCEKQELLDRVLRLWNDLQTSPAVDKISSDDLCKICMDAPIECVILECGHMATCTNCGKVLSECPICRQYIVRVVRFFRA